MYKPNYKSKCCGAKVKVEGGIPDFVIDREAVTIHYICQKCKKPCDILEEDNKVNA